MTEILRSYPPELSPNSLSFLLTSLIDYSLSHGIIVRPREPSENNYLASHAPVTLFPSLFPRNAWEQALKVQTIYNVLYARIANDVEWLAEIMAQYFAGNIYVDVGSSMWTNSFDNYGHCTQMSEEKGLFKLLLNESFLIERIYVWECFALTI